ncbi:MAG: ABC transporter ATP-binding protein [Cyanobacteria bacterium P01_E01_bin.6]
MSNKLIDLINISKVYGSNETEVRAISNVNLSISSGEFCSIMGSSGSGKSTVMSIIGGLDRPSNGKYLLDGIDIRTYSDIDLARIRNCKIGFVFQRFYLLPQLTALENVALPMIYAGVPQNERTERSENALSRVKLQDRMENKPHQLSGGQQQRVAIARAIINNPLLLLADEPTGSLDSKTSLEVVKIFQELNCEGITIVLVTHELDLGKISKRIIWFRDGCVIESDIKPEEIDSFLPRT